MREPIRSTLALALFSCACAGSPAQAQGSPPCPDTSLFRGVFAFGVESWQYSAATPADFNEDGIPDLALGVLGGLAILLGEPAATRGGVAYGKAVVHRYPAASTGVAVGDFNGDGILDIAVVGGGIFLFRGLGANSRGDGRFEPYEEVPLPDLGWDIKAADVNADGALDLVVGGYNNNLIVLQGNKTAGLPNGRFGPSNAIPSNGHLKGFELADLNADGALDVVAATELSWITVHQGLFGSAGPNGAFGPPMAIEGFGPRSTYDITIADFNGDGRLDAASANYSSRTVTVYLGDGNMGFPTIVDHPVAGLPLGIGAADFDGDDRMDLVVAAASGASFSFLRNHGTSPQSLDGFRSTIAVGAPRTGYGIGVGDVNGDGSVDVVVPAHNDTMVTVFPNSCFTDAPTPTLVSVVSVESRHGLIELLWHSGEHGFQPELQRRVAEMDWSSIGTLLADGRGFLRYRDLDVSPGRTYGYRLVTRDGDRLLTFGEAWATAPGHDLHLLGSVQTPALGSSCVVHYSLASTQPARLELIDLAGRRRLFRALEPVPGPATIELPLEDEIPPGIYWLRLVQSGDVRHKRLVVAR